MKINFFFHSKLIPLVKFCIIRNYAKKKEKLITNFVKMIYIYTPILYELKTSCNIKM